MATLDEATAALPRLHGIVERMAIAVRSQQNTAQFGAQIRRAGAPLVGLLKGQFGMIADQAMALNMGVSRGSNEQVRVRMLREGIGALRQAIDVAIVRVKENHAEKEKASAPDAAD